MSKLKLTYNLITKKLLSKNNFYDLSKPVIYISPKKQMLKKMSNKEFVFIDDILYDTYTDTEYEILARYTKEEIFLDNMNQISLTKEAIKNITVINTIAGCDYFDDSEYSTTIDFAAYRSYMLEYCIFDKEKNIFKKVRRGIPQTMANFQSFDVTTPKSHCIFKMVSFNQEVKNAFNDKNHSIDNIDGVYNKYEKCYYVSKITVDGITHNLPYTTPMILSERLTSNKFYGKVHAEDDVRFEYLDNGDYF